MVSEVLVVCEGSITAFKSAYVRLLGRMRALVAFELAALAESGVTPIEIADVWPLTSVRTPVSGELACVGKCRLAHIACVRLLTCMCAHMRFKMPLLCKCSAAPIEVAGEWLFARMRQGVPDEGTLRGERCTAVFAHESPGRPFTRHCESTALAPRNKGIMLVLLI